ncbi:hypothetical protein TNIN_302831 [Trichonephila inaurata madagascariensis]|uniref:Antimicrobial peptide n=1 Tax=Trichonephila inaurata madagascariensis TaxID=2747483 RepID=A0A8X6Y4N9_9ARAC|nr:hypothetical protein TNIN_302831 [Trichonephila inaurata madagascariensis]
MKLFALFLLVGLASASIEVEVKKEIGSRLREILNKILERVKEGIEQGKVVREEIFDKVKELREKLKVIKEDLAADDQVEEALAELNFRDLLRKLKEHLKKTIDPELLKEKIEKIFGQGSELLDRLLETLRRRARGRCSSSSTDCSMMTMKTRARGLPEECQVTGTRWRIT